MKKKDDGEEEEEQDSKKEDEGKISEKKRKNFVFQENLENWLPLKCLRTIIIKKEVHDCLCQNMKR